MGEEGAFLIKGVSQVEEKGVRERNKTFGYSSQALVNHLLKSVS